MKETIVSLVLVILSCGLAIAQEGTPPPPGVGPDQRMGFPQGPPGGGRRPGMRPPGLGKWWKNSELMQKIGVSDDQVQRIEKIFQDHRLQLIDLHAALEREEATLDPLIEADQPDVTQVVAQIDRVAQARANLEKSDAQMLLAIRRVLTVDQWKKLRNQPGILPPHAGPGFRPPVPPLPDERGSYGGAPREP